MVTIISFFVSLFAVRKRLSASPVTMLFVVALLIKIVMPFWLYKELSLLADLLAALSIVIIILVSTVNIRKKTDDGLPRKFKVNFSQTIALLSLGNFLFLFPLIYSFSLPPILVSINDGYLSGHDLRIHFTKEHPLAVLISLGGKFLVPISILALGFAYNGLNKSGKRLAEFLIVLSALIASFYLQKALPITTSLIFFLGLLLAGQITRRQIFFGAVIALASIFMLSRLFVENWSDAFTKFNDLVLRRLGKVPAQVYDSYIQFKEENGVILLESSFQFFGKNAEPLPTRIYHYMAYGSNDVGWANGFFVGDAYVNFGVLGVIFCSFIVGFLIRIGNKRVVRTKKITLSKLIMYVSICSVCFYLPGNAFFSGTIFFFIFLFVGIFLLEKVGNKNF